MHCNLINKKRKKSWVKRSLVTASPIRLALNDIMTFVKCIAAVDVNCYLPGGVKYDEENGWNDEIVGSDGPTSAKHDDSGHDDKSKSA